MVKKFGKHWLILTQYYPPEIGAPQIRLRSLAKELRGRGIDVEVLTAMPNYPNGEIFRAYRTDKTPTFILVGKDGTILDRNLRGKALVSRIRDVAECHDWMLPNVSRLIQ